MAIIGNSFGDLSRLQLARDSGIANRILQSIALRNQAAQSSQSARRSDLGTLLNIAGQIRQDRSRRKSQQAEAEERRKARALQLLQLGDVNKRFAAGQKQQQEMAQQRAQAEMQDQAFSDALGLVQSGLEPESVVETLNVPPSMLPALQAQRRALALQEQREQQNLESTAQQINETLRPVFSAVQELQAAYNTLRKQEDVQSEDVLAKAAEIANKYGITMPMQGLGSLPDLLTYAGDIEDAYLSDYQKGKATEGLIFNRPQRAFVPQRRNPLFSGQPQETGNGPASPVNRSGGSALNRVQQLMADQNLTYDQAIDALAAEPLR